MIKLLTGTTRVAFAAIQVIKSSTIFQLQNVVSRSISTTSVLHRYGDPRKRETWKGIGTANHRWEPIIPIRERIEYTTEPIKLPRTGGRGPNGRIWQYRRGGGRPKKYFMVDWTRGGPGEGEPLLERVLEISTDDHRNAKLAKVGQGQHKRWIIATDSMKVGDMIKSTMSTDITELKHWKEGDALPLINLPVGSLVYNVPKQPDKPGRMATSAGAAAQILRFVDGNCVLRLPSKQDIIVSAQCQCVLGRAGYDGYSMEKMKKAGENRWKGIKPKSGLWHRKGGEFGRKAKKVKKVKSYIDPVPVVDGKKRRLFPDMVV